MDQNYDCGQAGKQPGSNNQQRSDIGAQQVYDCRVGLYNRLQRDDYNEMKMIANRLAHLPHGVLLSLRRRAILTHQIDAVGSLGLEKVPNHEIANQLRARKISFTGHMPAI